MKFKFWKSNSYQYEGREYPETSGYSFWCPGCHTTHHITTSGGNTLWTVTNPEGEPTVQPSILIRLPLPLRKGSRELVNFVCHSFVRNGQIEFLGDCSHHLKGQVVPLVHLDSEQAQDPGMILHDSQLIKFLGYDPYGD